MVDLECKIVIIVTINKAETYLMNQVGSEEIIDLIMQHGIDRMIKIINDF
jgi:hypothetical protein